MATSGSGPIWVAVLVLIVVLAAVLLILILTLRALAAPLYLLASVVVSCAAALGLTTLVFQHLLGQDIHFTVPVITFVLLVAVGADYNILLMSRMRESGLALTRSEVARAVTADALSRQRQLVLTRLRRMGVDVIEAPYDKLGFAVIDRYLALRAQEAIAG